MITQQLYQPAEEEETVEEVSDATTLSLDPQAIESRGNMIIEMSNFMSTENILESHRNNDKSILLEKIEEVQEG